MSDIDAIIDAAQTAPTAQPQADATTPQPQEQATTETPDADSPEQQHGDDDNVVFPKKAINALSRKDKQIGKLRAQLEQFKAMQQQAPKPEAQTVQSKNDGAPKEADFESYADFLEAKTEWKLEQKLAEREARHATTQQSQQDQQYLNQRIADVDRQSAEFAKEYPEINSVVQEHAETIQELPQNIKLALLKADNPPLALLNLAKSGMLEELGDMSLEDARVEIKLALRQQPAKPQSNAPRPLAASRGSVASSKSLDSMSGKELLNWVKS